MLPSLTAAFLLGLVFGSQTTYFPLALFLLLLGVAVALTLLEHEARIESCRARLLYAALLGGVTYWTLVTPLPLPHDVPAGRRDVPFTDMSGRIVSAVQHAPNRQTLVVEAEERIPGVAGQTEQRRIRVVWRESEAVLLHGDRIRFRAKLHLPSGSLNPGGFDYAGYLERQGIDAVTTIAGPQAAQLLESGQVSWRWAAWNRVDQWRATIREAAVRTLSQPALGLYLGIVIGERGYLQQDVQEWFMVTGTVHLLSISGSHLGLVAVAVFWLVRQAVLWIPASLLLRLSRTITASRIAILVTWPMVAMYALLAGAELATIRSLVMITLALVTLWIGHQRHLHHAAALAALLILLHDPRALFDISFQLSFLSVLIIIQCVRWSGSDRDELAAAPALLPRLARHGRDALLMSGAVTIATLPVVALYFNQVPWMGMVTNLVAIPMTGMVLVPLGLCTALWSVVTGADDLPLGPLQERLVRWLVLGLRWCAGLPAGEWHIAAPSFPAMALFYGALGIAGVGRLSGRCRAGGLAIALALVCWWMWSPRLSVDGDRWRVTFLDVGQGDSAVIELPDGHTVLIDGGARYERFDMGRGVVAPFLWNRGIRHLDQVIGTHQQLDHVGGLAWVLRHVSVGRYWGTGVDRPEQFAADLQSALRDRGIQERVAVRGQELLPSGPCRLMIVNPEAPTKEAGSALPVRGGTALNNQSIVSRLECGAQSVLFAADIEADGLRHLGMDGRRPATILKVPHHGAKSSLDREWVKAIHPAYAVISVGAANSYGHPVQAVLDAYAQEQTTLARTDRDGAVWVSGRLSAQGVTVTRMRDRLLQPIDLHACLWPCEKENWRRLWLQFLDFR